ncbi:hypothetical protein DNTS_007173 [Danionella cerebrum]|uniref:Uncharacterized protein n=1 Tax=Danionella cerebrum TaxID=2873325 RepID=A0A553N4P8_9TELE|nr:hypothetical protein DNTS_007173 [Danionella translucida]
MMALNEDFTTHPPLSNGGSSVNHSGTDTPVEHPEDVLPPPEHTSPDLNGALRTCRASLASSSSDCDQLAELMPSGLAPTYCVHCSVRPPLVCCNLQGQMGGGVFPDHFCCNRGQTGGTVCPNRFPTPAGLHLSPCAHCFCLQQQHWHEHLQSRRHRPMLRHTLSGDEEHLQSIIVSEESGVLVLIAAIQCSCFEQMHVFTSVSPAADAITPQESSTPRPFRFPKRDGFGFISSWKCVSL